MRVARYKKENPHKHAMLNAKRRANTHMPPWTSHDKMADFYDMANQLSEMLGVQYHVDHIVPIQSPIVCGLHSHTNLQVVPASINIAKGNRHWPDMP